MKSKYKKETILKVLNLLNRNFQIKEITNLTGVPDTTIRNWKYNYSNLSGTNRKLNNKLKKESIKLLNKGNSIPAISKKLGVNYDSIRLFLKKELNETEYGLIKSSNRKLSEQAKILTPELAYILGVMYGDGHFALGQMRLGTKDKDFLDYFVRMIEIWCKKRPSQVQFIQNNKPYYECYLSFKDATEFIQNLLNNKKEIPNIVKSSNNKIINSLFIKGFSDSEGTIITNKKKANYLKIYNQNKLILHQIKSMLVKLGFDEKKIYITFNNKAKHGDIYAIRICYKDQLKLFYNTIGFTIQRKSQILEKILKNK